MNFEALKAELAARGFDYLPDERLGQYVNWACAELDELASWPYRLFTVAGPAPLDLYAPLLTLSRLPGPIESVTDTTNNRALRFAERRELTHRFGELTAPGAPEFYYVDGATVRVYPVAPVALSVGVFAIKDELQDPESEPAAPTRWHRLVLDIAVRMAYRDSDNHEAAAALSAQIEQDKAAMMLALLIVSNEPGYVEQRAGW